MSTSARSLSVLMPTYQRVHLLPRVLEAWRACLRDLPGAELVVVDDGSSDGTPEVLTAAAVSFGEQGIGYRVVRQDNQGLAAARNAAIEASRGDIVLFSDDDMVPSSNALAVLHLQRQAESPGAWVSRLVVPDEVVDTHFQRYWRRRLHGGTEPLTEGQDLGKGGFWFATLSIPRELLGEDRFSRAFTKYGWEEHELGYRLWQRGVRPKFLRSAVIEHHDQMTIGEMERKFEQFGASAWMFASLHPSTEVRVWTGTHPLSRFGRRFLLHEVRARQIRKRDPETLSDRDWVVLLEAAYGRGLRAGKR